MGERFDHIVVGGGSAGCVAAGALVSKGRRVLLLEAGPMDNSVFIRMPAGAFKIVFGGLPYYHGWRSVAAPDKSVESIQLHRANVLGGGSSINVGVYTRGNPGDYDRWVEATGDDGWSWESLLPYFTGQEGNQRLDGAAHGRSGPLKVSDPRYVSPIAELFVESMLHRGSPLNDDFNNGAQSGVGYFQSTHYRGRRCSAVDAFLRPHIGGRRLTLRTAAEADRLIIENQRVVGVCYRRGDELRNAYCDGDLILTAGAYSTPKILMRSGIGPARHLRECNIDVILDQPLIGDNLMDHPMVGVTAFTRPDLGYFKQDSGWRLARNLVQYAFARRGPIASNGSEACAFINVREPRESPSLQIYCLGMIWPDSYAPVLPSHGLTLHAALLQPQARGSVRLDVGRPAGEVQVHTGFLADARDLDEIVTGVELLRDLLRSGPLADVTKRLVSPGDRSMTRAQLESFCRQVVVSNAHAAGTCAMGKSAKSALDSHMRLNGLTGLRVLDASAFPALPSANINATVMACAARAVDLMT